MNHTHKASKQSFVFYYQKVVDVSVFFYYGRLCAGFEKVFTVVIKPWFLNDQKWTDSIKAHDWSWNKNQQKCDIFKALFAKP